MITPVRNRDPADSRPTDRGNKVTHLKHITPPGAHAEITQTRHAGTVETRAILCISARSQSNNRLHLFIHRHRRPKIQTSGRVSNRLPTACRIWLWHHVHALTLSLLVPPTVNHLDLDVLLRAQQNSPDKEQLVWVRLGCAFDREGYWRSSSAPCLPYLPILGLGTSQSDQWEVFYLVTSKPQVFHHSFGTSRGGWKSPLEDFLVPQVHFRLLKWTLWVLGRKSTTFNTSLTWLAHI